MPCLNFTVHAQRGGKLTLLFFII